MADVTETRHGLTTGRPAPQAIGLVAVFQEGPGRPAPIAVAVRAPCRIGRDEFVRIRIHDSQASREHAEVAVGEGAVLVTDLQSRNGTFIDGVKVDTPRSVARVGTTIRCGKTLLRVVSDVASFEQHPLFGPGPLIGGPGLAEVRRVIQSAAVLAAPVLLEGETGTGKERVAEALHVASRRQGAYIPVNCAAIPTDLVESELFGHTRGAFSGSDRARTGLIRAAEQGTLLLDEIGDLPLSTQAKLLRFLEGGEVRPVGSDQTMHVDARVVAATNLSLDNMVSQGKFRADLLHRIAALRIRVPALRDRREDIPSLALHFLPTGVVGLSVECVERLLSWSWPGNVRELRNTVLAAASHATSEGASHIEPRHLPPSIAMSAAAVPQASEDNEEAVMRAKIETALRLREGNVAQVARDLAVGRPWLYQVLHRMQIDPASFRKR